MSERTTRAVPAVVLAAGGSTRCPGGKLTREFGGRPLLYWTLETLQQSPLVSAIVLVCGFQGESVAQAAEPFGKVRTVSNPLWPEGLASSLRTGIGAVPQSSPGALVCLADTPFFKAETLRALIPVDDLNLVVLPRYQGRHGHPKYFPHLLFPELLKLEGDEGARSILRRFQEKTRIVEVDDPGILKDFDTPEDFS